MRVAPLGAWYADDPEQATHQAEISAYTTHQHREAVVGAMAVAAAAALVADPAGPPSAEDLLDGVIALVPRSAVRRRAAAGPRHARLRRRRRPSPRYSAAGAAPAPTTPCRSPCGRRPAISATTSGRSGPPRGAGGDVDTTCAIVGGIVAARPDGEPPRDWTERTEALPEWAVLGLIGPLVRTADPGGVG